MSPPLFFLPFPGLYGVSVWISYVTEVMSGIEDVWKQEWGVCALTLPRTPSPVLSTQKQVGADGIVWGHLRQEGAFPKMVLMLTRVPMCKLSMKSAKIDFQKSSEKRSSIPTPRPQLLMDLALVSDQATAFTVMFLF